MLQGHVDYCVTVPQEPVVAFSKHQAQLFAVRHFPHIQTVNLQSIVDDDILQIEIKLFVLLHDLVHWAHRHILSHIADFVENPRVSKNPEHENKVEK